MGNTVSLCMIVKNEIKNIGRIIDSACPILEEVIIVDTGSIDGTLELLTEKAAEYENLEIDHFEWIDDFSAARNYSFSKATQEFLFWLDSDDSFDIEKLAHFKNHVLDDPNVDVWTLDYIYSKFPDGRPQLVLGRERFIRRSLNRKWQGAIHEAIDINGLRQRHYDDLKIVHLRSELGKVFDYERNIRILEKEYNKNPKNPRIAYYYGKELFGRMDDRGVGVLEKFLELPGAWFDDIVNARESLARAYLVQKNHGKALRTVDEIYHLDGTRARAGYYWTYGAVEQDLKNYQVAIEWYERCLRKPPPPPRVLHLEYYTWNPLWRISECYHALGNWPKALEYARKAEQHLPGEATLQSWIKTIKSTKPTPRSSSSKIVAVEIGSIYRPDSIRYQTSEINLDDLPFGDASLTGMVLGSDKLYYTEEIKRVIQPGGFLWATCELNQLSGFGYLGYARYGKTGPYFHSYTREDESKPRVFFIHGDLDFGPYRIRIENLRLSAIKSGFPVSNKNYDMLISSNLNHCGDKGKAIWVLDICEKLPSYNLGAEKADAIVACSPLLKEHLENLYPDKPIIHLDDHAEFTPEGWL